MKRKHHLKIQINEMIWIGCIVASALILRLVIGGGYYNDIDTVNYNIPWAKGIGQGLLSAYSNMENLNYPPLFPFLLYFISEPIQHAVEVQNVFLQMFWIKLIPILFDSALIILLYVIGRKYNRLLGLFLATMWALNISAIFNCSFGDRRIACYCFGLLLCLFHFSASGPIWPVYSLR